jgi:hypothetical protein
MAGVAAIGHHPARHAWQAVEQQNGLRQLMRLTGRDPKGDRPSEAVRDHASLGAIATTRAAKRRDLKRLIAANRQAASIDALAGDAAAWVLATTDPAAFCVE